MKVKKIINIIVFFILNIFTCSPSHAGFSVGIGTLYNNINDSRFKFKNQEETLFKPSSVNVGYNKSFKNINLSISTNRLINTSQKRMVVINNKLYAARFKTTYDLFQVGYGYKRLLPAIFLANTKQETTIFNTETKHTFIFGSNIGYFVNKKLATSIIYLMPNKELNMDSSFGFSINYFF